MATFTLTITTDNAAFEDEAKSYEVARILRHLADNLEREHGELLDFSIVYDLSATLYRTEDGSYSHDGAYCLNHAWI